MWSNCTRHFSMSQATPGGRWHSAGSLSRPSRLDTSIYSSTDNASGDMYINQSKVPMVISMCSKTSLIGRLKAYVLD